jgi:hypothetical protein
VLWQHVYQAVVCVLSAVRRKKNFTEEVLQVWRQCETLRSGLSDCSHVIEFHTDGFLRCVVSRLKLCWAVWKLWKRVERICNHWLLYACPAIFSVIFFFLVTRNAKFAWQHVLQIRTDFLTAMTMKIAIFWDETPCSLIVYRHCWRACFLLRVFPSTLMMEVARYSEASVHVYQATRCHIADDSSLIA